MIAFTVAEMFAWAAVFGVYEDNTTPLGYGGDRIEGYGQYGYGTLSYLVQSGVRAPIPDGVQATLVLVSKSGNQYSFSAVITQANLGTVTAVAPRAQRAAYRFRLSNASAAVQLANP